MATAAPGISAVRPAVTSLEWGYRGSFVLTSIALTALSYYSLPWYSCCLIAHCYSLFNINTEVKKESSPADGLKRLATVASLVSCCFVISLIFRSLPSVMDGFQELKTFDWATPISYIPGLSHVAEHNIPSELTGDLSSALFYFMIFPLVAGYGIPIAQKLYARGLELLKMSNFEPMEFYQSRPKEYKKLVSLFLDKCAFACEIIAPGCLENFPFTPRIQVMTTPFCSEELQEERYSKLLSYCENYSPKEARVLWETALYYLFIKQKKWGLLSLMVDQSQKMSSEMRGAFNGQPLFPAEVHQEIERKTRDINENYSVRLVGFQRRLSHLQEQLRQPEGRPELETGIISSATGLFKELKHEYEQIRIFCPDLDSSELQKCQHELGMGQTQKTLQAIHSRRMADRVFDPARETWDYFLSIPNPDPTQKYSYYKKLLKLFRIEISSDDELFQTQNTLDEALRQSKIETMGAFVEKVFNGDATQLQNPDKALDELETYLKDDRQILYRKLAGRATEKAHMLAFVASRVTYLAVMILIALTPILMYPKMVIAGFVLSLPYYASPSLQDVLFLTLMFSSALGVINIFKLAIQRPVLGLIKGGHPALMHTYDTSNLPGKMRILGTELLNANIYQHPIGGAAAGAAIGREVWGYFWPQNVRRQYFIDRGESVG